MTYKEIEDYKYGEIHSTEIEETEDLSLHVYQRKPESYLDLSTLILSKINQQNQKERRSSLKKKRQRKSHPNEANFTKAHIKYIPDPSFTDVENIVEPNEEQEENQENIIHLNFPKEQICPESLRKLYGNSYIKGETKPRRFCITENTKEPKSSKIIVTVVFQLGQSIDVKMEFKGFEKSFDFKNVFLIINGQENGINFETVVDIFYPNITSVEISNQESKSQSKCLQPFETKLANDLLVESGFLRNKKDGATVFESEELETQKMECCNCFASVGKEFLAIKKCLHYFCNSCWKIYIESKITGGFCGDIKCMEFDCKASIDSVSILSIVSWERFCLYVQEFQRQLIKRNKFLQTCPTDSCQSVVIINDVQTISSLSNGRNGSTLTNSLSVTCNSCKRDWCFSCKQPNHWPMSCQTYGKFKTILDKFKSRTVKTVSGKHCPFCGSFVEKNGGCTTMVCICSSEDFCWLCTRPFSEHEDRWSCDLPFVDEKEFKPKVRNQEVRISKCLEMYASSENKGFPKLLKYSKVRKPRGYPIAKESIKALSKSMNISLLLEIAIIMDRSVSVSYKSCLKRLRFNNSLLYQLLDHGLQTKSLDTIAMETVCKDIDNIYTRMSRIFFN